MVRLSSLLIAGAALLSTASAHPGGHEPEDLHTRDALWQASKRTLADCASSDYGRKMAARAVARRSELANRLRKKRGIEHKPMLHRRDFDTILATSHFNATLNGTISQNADPALLFTGNTSCILAPEVTQGPYFVAGEHVRQDVRMGQEGVDLYLDMQFIDVNTCEPLQDIYLDIWHANATGVYSGIVASGNGDETDTSNLDKTFLRGLWKTDDEGVVQFLTIFPGHYSGRATHVHVVAHQGGTQHLNGTFTGGNITHVGQLFWDETLRAAVEKVEPYAGNTQPITSNEEDMWAPSAADNDYNPFPEYVFLGEGTEDGILGWISIGVDSTASKLVEYAVTLTEDGGVVNDGFAMGGGGGAMPSGGMGGEMPSGGIPSGMMPSGSMGGAIPSGVVPGGSVMPSGSAVPA